MGVVTGAFGAKRSPQQAVPQTSATAPSSPIELPGAEDAIIASLANFMAASQDAGLDGKFETGEKSPPLILCSEKACPCTDKRPLVIGATAYLYISEGAVDFRKDCRTLLERDVMLTEVAKRLDSVLFLDSGVVNPVYLCENGARLRGLDLTVALADAKMVAETGFAPLRPTPRAN